MKSLKTDLTLFWFSLKALSLRNWKIHTFMNRIKGILYAIVSSSTFGLAPFFTLTLLSFGYSSFEVLTYRWGIASLCLIGFGLLAGCNFRLSKKDFGVVFLLSLFRATTSFSLVIAYQNIASGVASTIHFMYPLAVALAMIFFYHEKKSRLGHFGSTPIHSRSNPLIFRQYSRL